MKKTGFLLYFLGLTLVLVGLAVLVYIRATTDILLPAVAEPEIIYQEVVVTPEPVHETPEPTPEPQPEYFTISAAGDLTLASHQYTNDFAARMGDDYSYPFSNVAEYFKNDELTISNLECTFSDQSLYSSRTFYFRSPSSWANILVEGDIDFVTTCNNHDDDFGEQGMTDTYAALDAVGVAYGKEDQAQIVVSDNGIKFGIYCAFDGDDRFYPSKDKSVAAIQQLQADGADYIICMFHWGIELHYTPEQYMVDLAHACVDAGADLVYGTHTHTLEPVEKYNDGIILYSMGNFSFGGNTDPTDWDTAIVQIIICRDVDGTVSNSDIVFIPCCCSEGKDSNDYRPTPYEEGTEEYDRIISKLDGTYTGGNLEANYSAWYNSHGQS